MTGGEREDVFSAFRKSENKSIILPVARKSGRTPRLPDLTPRTLSSAAPVEGKELSWDAPLPTPVQRH